MDFHSLLRRDLQFLCKRNKIPANMTNLAMADALKSLEIVDGLDEYMNQSESNAQQSPTSVAKLPPNTAARTTRRKTTTKAEPQSSSQLVSRSCRATSKSLAGEMDQEDVNKNVVQEPKTNTVKFEANVHKTPAARSTRKASAANSCTKKDELVQSVYSTRRSTRLLEKCMADLSLKTKETLDNIPAKNEDTELKVSAQEKNLAGSEGGVIPGRDLSVSMEQVWENLKNDTDQVVGDLAVMDAITETNKEKMNEVLADEKESENSLVQADKQEETLHAICEEGPKKNDNDQEIEDLEIYVDLDISVLESGNTETHNDDNGSKNVLTFDSPVDQQETEHAIEENDSEPETKVDQTDSDAGDSKPKQAIQENDCEPEKINNFDEDTMVDQTDSDAGDSETEPEEDHSGVDSDGTISEADSNQAVLGSDTADEDMTLSESEGSAATATAPNSPPLLEEAKVIKTTPVSPFAAEPISVQFPRPSKPTTPLKNSALKLVNENKENNMEVMMMNVNKNENGESKGEEGKKKKKKVTINEENLKDASLRQLMKMFKELSIKSSNRTALQILPGNNQTAE
ncbi:hypothetical protein ISN45_Aa06g016740 [Arabidopsis thaliana x Arabidopsis arenosa]|uniref:Uncharacterized protein n=1 Tax=Arabidopsis thaliana x Arabidopsis arenosa TaxID=1240361 RepID=A0A8T1YWT1_9BRAS|nr:hypothetical protein ISN45_Aa06g016740 [Arabidopsis thaliana x Arabidopsis arenosa]